VIAEAGSEQVIGRDVFKQQKESVMRWPMAQQARLLAELDLQDPALRVIDFGTADPTPFSGHQDYTNLALIMNGELLLVDPSVRTLRNLEEMGLMGKVNAIFLSHHHSVSSGN